MNKLDFKTIPFFIMLIGLLGFCKPAQSGTIVTFDESFIETSVYTPETYYNIVGSLLVEVSDDDYEIVIRDKGDSDNIPPTYRITKLFFQPGSFIPLTANDLITPSPFGDDEAYRITIPRSELGEFILEFQDTDAVDGSAKGATETITELRGIFVLPSTEPGIYLLHSEENFVSRGITVYPPGVESLTHQRLNSLVGNLSNGYIDINVTNSTYFPALADAWTIPFGLNSGLNILTFRAIEGNETILQQTFFLNPQNNPGNENITASISSPQNNDVFEINDGVDSIPIIVNLNNDGFTGPVTNIKVNSQVLVNLLDDNGDIINGRREQFFDFQNVSSLRTSNLNFQGDFLNLELTARLFEGRNRIYVSNQISFGTGDTEILPIGLDLLSVDVEAVRTEDGLIRIVGASSFSNFGNKLDRDVEIQLSDIDFLNKLEYRFELEDFPYINEWITIEETSFNEFDFFAPGWFGDNKVEVRATRLDAEVFTDSFTFQTPDSIIPQVISLDPALDGSFISNNEIETDYNLTVSGKLSSDYFEFPARGNEIRLFSTLVSESGEFLDQVDAAIYSLDEIETNFDMMTSEISWNAPIKVETGFNKITAHYLLEIPDGAPVPADSITLEVEGQDPTVEDIATLTEFSDFWRTDTDDTNLPGFQSPARIDFTGFDFDLDAGDIVFSEDLNGDNVDDFLIVTRFNSVFAFTLPPNEALTRLDPAFFYDESINATVLLGDINQTGLPDIIQITDKQIWISNPTAPLEYPDPVYLQDTPLLDGKRFLFNPQSGNEVKLVDMTGDGDLDLLFIDSGGKIWVMEFLQTRFDDPVFLGDTDFVVSNLSEIVIGDFNGDGLNDLCYAHFGRAIFVALAEDETGKLNTPTRWGGTGIQGDLGTLQNNGIFAARTNGSNRDDIILVTSQGETWIMKNQFNDVTGIGSFDNPVKNSSIGFSHNQRGSWHSYVGDFFE